MHRPAMISVIIPNYNGSATLDACLQAATGWRDEALEIIVVDDGSDDHSVDIIKRYDCQLVQLPEHRGAAYARNIGAQHSRGDILFFTDADCLINPGVLSRLRHRFSIADSQVVIGGTYTPLPYDTRFCSRFQSVFIHYAETRHMAHPDYVASHAMAIRSKTFRDSGGFNDSMGPILEDVEFSHRLRRSGIKLAMEPGLQVQHIFNYSLLGSWRNAIRKSRYWIQYSLNNRDLFSDSGTASIELKINVCSFYLCLALLIVSISGHVVGLAALVLLAATNMSINRGLFTDFLAVNTPLNAIASILYYLALYPVPVGIGSLAGVMGFLHNKYHIRQHV